MGREARRLGMCAVKRTVCSARYVLRDPVSPALPDPPREPLVLRSGDAWRDRAVQGACIPLHGRIPRPEGFLLHAERSGYDLRRPPSHLRISRQTRSAEG
jgi:hypothetical protein